MFDKIDDGNEKIKDGFIINDSENNTYTCCKLFMATGIRSRKIPEHIYTKLNDMRRRCRRGIALIAKSQDALHRILVWTFERTS